jgi:hypothetical protein
MSRSVVGAQPALERVTFWVPMTEAVSAGYQRGTETGCARGTETGCATGIETGIEIRLANGFGRGRLRKGALAGSPNCRGVIGAVRVRLGSEIEDPLRMLPGVDEMKGGQREGGRSIKIDYVWPEAETEVHERANMEHVGIGGRGTVLEVE